MSGNAHDAEELTQEAFTRALEKQDQFREDTSVRSWLFRIAVNRFIDQKRRQQPTRLDENACEQIIPDHGTVPDIETKELNQILHDAIDQLPQHQKLVFLLRSVEECSFEQIAEIIGTTEPTARWHMMQARKHLVRLLEGRV